jgi:hypothetical protein
LKAVGPVEFSPDPRGGTRDRIFRTAVRCGRGHDSVIIAEEIECIFFSVVVRREILILVLNRGIELVKSFAITALKRLGSDR